MVYPVRPKFSATTVLRSVVICSGTTTVSHLYSIPNTLLFHQLSELHIKHEAETHEAAAVSRTVVEAISRANTATVASATPKHARFSTTDKRVT